LLTLNTIRQTIGNYQMYRTYAQSLEDRRANAAKKHEASAPGFSPQPPAQRARPESAGSTAVRKATGWSAEKFLGKVFQCFAHFVKWTGVIASLFTGPIGAALAVAGKGMAIAHDFVVSAVRFFSRLMTGQLHAEETKSADQIVVAAGQGDEDMQRLLVRLGVFGLAFKSKMRVLLQTGLIGEGLRPNTIEQLLQVPTERREVQFWVQRWQAAGLEKVLVDEVKKTMIF
jgi:hypothetical protein